MIEKIWDSGIAINTPPNYNFRDGMVTYFIEKGLLFAQVWKSYDGPLEQYTGIMQLKHTTNISEDDDSSMHDLINNIQSWQKE
jgi:hypothetical protein